MLRSHVDVVSRREVAGWAQDDAQPDTPVSLLILDNDELVGRVLANRHRPDLEAAGIGSGRHAFRYEFTSPLSAGERHVIRVCRERDGANLHRSPVILEVQSYFDESAEQAL